jgi:hypothetical protein
LFSPRERAKWDKNDDFTRLMIHTGNFTKDPFDCIIITCKQQNLQLQVSKVRD